MELEIFKQSSIKCPVKGEMSAVLVNNNNNESLVFGCFRHWSEKYIGKSLINIIGLFCRNTNVYLFNTDEKPARLWSNYVDWILNDSKSAY